MNIKTVISMACEMATPSNKYARYGMWLVGLFVLFVAVDAFVHRHEYEDLQFCRETFGEQCKLIAVPDSVESLIDHKK